MMKYGYSDEKFREDLWDSQTKFARDVADFDLDCFIPAMRRKTVTGEDEFALKALTEMVEMLNQHFAEARRV
jgi:hypothetical protein